MSKLTVGDVRVILEEHEIYSHGGDADQGFEEFGYNSPCGEDFLIPLHHEDNAESLSNAFTMFANAFDPEDHAANWYNAQNDTTGVPESLKDLLEDAEHIKKVLVEAARDVEKSLSEGRPVEAVNASEKLDDLLDHLINYCVSDDYNFKVIRDELDYVDVDAEGNKLSFRVIYKGREYRISAEEVS